MIPNHKHEQWTTNKRESSTLLPSDFPKGVRDILGTFSKIRRSVMTTVDSQWQSEHNRLVSHS